MFLKINNAFMGTASTNDVLLKNLAYIPAFLLGLSFKGFVVLAVFMLIDVLTGVIRAYVVHGGQSVKSRRLGAGVVSKACIIAVPAIVAWAGEGAGIDLLMVAQGTLSVLILAEAYSILGNIQSIRLRRDIMEFDAVNFIILKLRDQLERMIKKDHEGK